MTVTLTSTFNGTHRRRLERLRDIMREVGKREMLMNDWFGEVSAVRETLPESTFSNLSLVRRAIHGEECGFAACAAGHACMDPVFRAEGLRASGTDPRFTPVKESVVHEGFFAITAFFGLWMGDAHYLFSMGAYSAGTPGVAHVRANSCTYTLVSGHVVADRIEALLASQAYSIKASTPATGDQP